MAAPQPPALTTAPPSVIPADDRTLPIVVYVLYILAIVNGVTALIGFVIALASRDAASPGVQSHYRFQIRTFLAVIALGLLGVVICVVGLPLLLVGVGALLLKLAAGVWALAGLYLLVRAIVGLVRLANGEPYLNPASWTI
jgi:uncharacterized membrane protein